MECSTCQNHVTDLTCPACVRNLLYAHRVELVRVLLEKETLGRMVNLITAPELDPSTVLDDDTAQLRDTWQTHIREGRTQREEEDDAELARLLQEVQLEVEEKKTRARALRDNLAERQANLAIAQKALVQGTQKTIGDGNEALAKEQADFEALHEKVVDTRATLCREAATLLNLRHVRKKTKEATVRDRYYITGLLIPDLREINNMRCTDLTAVLGTLTRLVYLCSFYVGVKLPAEITLPHRDYPLATINTPLTSYLSDRGPPFPGSGSAATGLSSPTLSGSDLSTFPQPRPIFIGSDDANEVVAQFAKREPVGFRFFVEAISLLAWDIAWFSRTQGFVAGTDSWEDVCDLGRNLYQMLLAPPPSATTYHARPKRQAGNHDHGPPNSTPPPDTKVAVGRLGSASHDSAHTFLRSHHDNPSKHWRLNNHTMVADPLKKHLLNEMNNAEWELLQEQEWEDGSEKMDEAVFIKTRAMDGRDYDDARSIMTTTTAARPASEDDDSTRNKGKSGWTKLKPREKP